MPNRSVSALPQYSLLTYLTLTADSDFEFWNLTFVMPANSSEVPSIQFNFSLE